MSEDEFLDLLGRTESTTLDFKQTAYNLSDELQQAELIKDVLCLANTPRECPSYIVLGVKKYSNGTYQLVGLDQHLDGADLQSQFTDRVYPLPVFDYSTVEHVGKTFGIITIHPERQGPSLPLKTFRPNRTFVQSCVGDNTSSGTTRSATRQLQKTLSASDDG